jgi:hypothetical protein
LEECEEEALPPDLDWRSAPTGVLGPDSPTAAATAASRRQPPAPDGARRTLPPPATDACTPTRRPSAFLTFLHAPSIAAKHKPIRLLPLPANRIADSVGLLHRHPPTGYTMTADRSAGRERERRRVLEGSRADMGE